MNEVKAAIIGPLHLIYKRKVMYRHTAFTQQIIVDPILSHPLWPVCYFGMQIIDWFLLPAMIVAKYVLLWIKDISFI